MKNSLVGFEGRYEQMEEGSSKFEERSTEIIGFEEKKEKRWKQNQRDLRATIKWTNIAGGSLRRRRERARGRENI